MVTILVIHEVDDVDRWLASTNREQVFGPLGITARTFVEQVQTQRVGLIVEAPDLETFQNALGSEAAAEAMSADGVRAGGMLVLVEKP
jgi:hypothetical protein